MTALDLHELTRRYLGLDARAQQILLKAARDPHEARGVSVIMAYLGTHDTRQLRPFVAWLRARYAGNATD